MDALFSILNLPLYHILPSKFGILHPLLPSENGWMKKTKPPNLNDEFTTNLTL
jgi:hypothetical protein